MEERYTGDTPNVQRDYPFQRGDSEVQESSGLGRKVHCAVASLIFLGGTALAAIVARESGGPSGMAVWGISILASLGYTDRFVDQTSGY